MIDLEIVRWIRGLDENGAVGLARALIFAEAGLHNLPLDEFTMSGRVKAADEGVDGRSHFPPEIGGLFPSGPCAWQVKSGSTRPSATKEFDLEKHHALVEAIAEGYDYVLFWTNDPVDQSGSEVRDDFSAAVSSIRAEATAHFLFTEAIERVCYAHLGVLAQASPYPLAGLVNLARWGAPKKFSDVEFQADDRRSTALPALQAHVSNFDSEPYELHVVGDTGVGKSRLVYEALAHTGIEQRVLVAPDASQFDRSLLTHVANSDERRLILVIDDCEAADRQALARYAGLATGRVRLITIGPRWSRDQPSADVRRIEVLPLEAQASRQIALSVGLDDRDADVVAEYTEGYPGLALALARAIRFGTHTESLVDRVRGNEEIGSVLASLLPADDVPRLGIVALFEKIGFEGDLAQELSLVCRVLNVDEEEIRLVVDRELGRFVSTAGRFRRVTPRLFAVWLATRLLSEDKATLRTALSELPESLRDRIVMQVRDFAGDPVVEEVLGDILTQHPFLEGTLSDVDEGAGRLLHVAAIAAPAAAMDAVDRVLAGVTQERLSAFGPARREMVWALEILLWFEDLFDRAADAMLRLALAENETWANNSTGIIQGVFRVVLGGTAAPYGRRLQWARGALDQFGDAALPIIVEGLSHAFDSHESRSSTQFGGRTAPDEWQPKSWTEELEARGGSWDLLFEIARTFPEETDYVAKVIARGLRTAIGRGLAERVLEDLRHVDWSPRARGLLGESLVKTMKYERPDEDLLTKLRELEYELQGHDLSDRLDYAFSLAPWQLSNEDDDRGSRRPKILRELAEEVAHQGSDEVLSVAQRSMTANSQTVGILFEELGRVINNEGLLRELEAIEPAPEAALLGALVGLSENRDGDWADSVLEGWMTGSLGSLVLRAAHMLPATDRRGRLAMAALDRGFDSPTSLGRFLYGAWTRPLSESVVLEIVQRLTVDGDSYGVEHALGILEQWVEDRDISTLSQEFRALALNLIGMASHLPDRSSSMVPLYRSRILRTIEPSFDELLAIVIEILRSLESFADSDDLELVDELVARDPLRTTEAIIDLLGFGDESYEPGVMWVEDARLLSRLQRLATPDLVRDVVLARVDAESWPRLLAHIDFAPDDPDPLLQTLLERSDDDTLRSQAAFRFQYPKSGWTGPESAHLQDRRRVAQRWIELSPAEGSSHAWLDALIRDIDDRIEAVVRDELERGY